MLWAIALGAVSAGSGCQMAANGYNLQGKRLFEQGQRQAALQEFQRAVSADPKNADAYYNLAATMHQEGKMQGDKTMLAQAETLYNQCLDYAPDHVDCHRGLAVLLVETGRQDRAFKLLENWAMRSPNIAAARVELARMYEEFGDAETAKLHLVQAIKVDEHNSRAHAALGRLREQSGDYAQALANYQRATNQNNPPPGVTDRIAALNQAVLGGINVTVPGGTRTVDAGSPSTRY